MDSLIMDLLIMELIDYLFQHFEHSGKSKTNIGIILTIWTLHPIYQKPYVNMRNRQVLEEAAIL